MNTSHLELWMGECHVHAKISPVQLRKKLAAEPDSQLLVHHEFGCTAAALTLLDDGEISPESSYPLAAMSRRSENGEGQSYDAVIFLAIRPYPSLASGPDLKGRSLCYEHAVQNFGPDRAPGATLNHSVARTFEPSE